MRINSKGRAYGFVKDLLISLAFALSFGGIVLYMVTHPSSCRYEEEC